MAETQILQELEMASQIMMAPPNVVTKEQRQSAEQVLLNFRTTKTPYNLCRHILESTSVDYVLFQVACTLREALIREWSFLQESDIISLRQYLFQFILNRTNIAPFVRERLLQVIAIMVKRGSVNDFGQERTRIVSEVENLIVSGDAVRQHLGCSIIAAIMQEYATTMKSCDVGLTWDTHFKVKKQFEATDLKRIFQFCVRALGELVRVEDANAQTVGLLQHLLSITSSILCWGFISAALPKRLIGMFETVYEADNSPPLRLGQMWKDVILDEAVISLFFQVHWKVRENQDLSHYSLVCLGQLATLSGTVVNDKDVQAQYITTYLTNFINFITSVEVLPWEALGIAQYLRKMLQHFSCSMLVTINGGELFTQFVQQLTRLTSRFAEGAAQEESVCVEDRRYMEAFDHLLEAWVSVLQSSHLYPADFCKQPAIDIFNTYLRCHLAPPDGTRGQGKPGDDSGDQDDQEIYETDEPDRIRFREQLIIIGLIGRQVLGHSLQVIARLLEERTERLRNQLQKAAAQNYSISDSSTTLSLFEDLHWLLLIAGHLVALESEGETALISDDIMRHSIQQGATVDVDASLRLLTTPGLTPEQLGVPITSVDDTVRVVAAVLRLCEVENQALEARMTGVLSPEVGSTLVWFLAHWATSYLLTQENLYGESWKCLQMSPVMIAAFSKPETGVPVWLANQLLGKVEVNLRLCPGEPALAKDSAALLVSLVDKHDKAAKLLHSSGLATVVRFLHTAAQCQAARRELAKGVILAATGHEQPAAKREFIKQVVQPFVDRFNAIISREDFKQACHGEQLRLEISDLLELFIGVSRGASASTAQPLFDTLRPVITQLAPLLSLYSNYSQLIELCLEFLSELTKRMLWFLDEASSHTMYQSCLSVMQTYTYDHSGRRSVSQSAAEEDVFRDLLLVMEVLTSLLSKDLVDYNNSAEGAVSAVDVCLLGIRTIMPLMTADLLKFPALCQQYYKMVCFAAEIYPERVSRLPDDQLAFLVSSVQMGLTEFGPDVSSLCCDFIYVLCHQIYGSNDPSHCRDLLHPFLRFMMDLILQGQFNADAMVGASKALFGLICCFQETYRQLVSDILASYPDAAVRERLTSAFNNLTNNLEMLPNRQNTVKFRENFEKFASNVHGFLIVR